MARVRRGDKVPLLGLEQLANSRADLKEILSDWAEKDVEVVNRHSGRGIHSGDVLWVANGLSAIDTKRRGLHPRKRRERMDEAEAAKIWRDVRLTWEEAIERMPGWSRKLAYLYLGARGVPVGRRAKG